LKLGSEANCC